MTIVSLFTPCDDTDSPVGRLVDVSEDLATHVLPACLLVVKDTARRRLWLCISTGLSKREEETHEDDVAEATSGEKQVDPLLEVADGDVVARRDDAGLVETTVELHDDLSRAMVIDDLELADVACPYRPFVSFSIKEWAGKETKE